jgi:hypothetical protein
MFKSTLAKNTACNAVTQMVDAGSIWPSGGIYLYDSTDFPRYNADSTSPTPIVRLPLSLPAFLTAADGTAFASMIYDATALRDGTAWGFGVFNRDSTFIWGGSVSRPTGLGEMKLNQNVIKQDQTVTLTNGYYLVP